MKIKDLLPIAIEAAERACDKILEVYHSGDFQVEAKGDDSPLTRADKKAHEVITAALHSTNLPVLSEEGRSIPYEERKGWEYFWMVDPLDGTKEFLKRNGEFTVNIALIHRQTPVLGVVAVPVSGDVYFAARGHGAFLKHNDREIRLPKHPLLDLSRSGLRVVASRSHMNEETQTFIGTLKHPVLVSKGSSLKFMLLAEGLADVYPRYAPTMEWDTAAAQAVVSEVGLKVLRHVNEQQGNAYTDELVYNKDELQNPYFLVIPA